MDESGRWQRGFWALIVTQFQGAFSDNGLKTFVTFVGLAAAGANTKQRETVVPLLGILFSAPFILFSMAGGFLADRFSKRTVTIGVKLFEILVMVFAGIGLWRHSLPAAMVAVCLMGVHSAFFGPSKYGLLPELLPEKRLSWGNGILELGTFMAIITGGAIGGLLYESFKGQPQVAGLVFLALAGIGLACSFGITKVPAANPVKVFRANFIGDLWQQITLIRRDRVLWLAVLGNVYFSFVGALVLQNAVLFGTDTLGVGELKTSYLQVALAIGVGLGSFAAGYLSGGKIEYGLVPLGAAGLTVFNATLGSPALSYRDALVHLALLGFFGGFFIVPIAAIMQHRPAKGQKGAVLAAGNLLSFVGIALASGVFWVLTVGGGLTTREVFLISAVLTLGATVYILWLLPDAFFRLLLWMLTHSIYRIRVEGRDNIPERGGALFVCNHVSFVDALLIQAATDRPLRPIVFQGIYDLWYVKPFLKLARAIPISSQLRPRDMIKSLREASEAIKNGEVVVIFAEGQITRIGQLLPFRRGYERIMKDVDAPIVPICLDHVWGSIFSFERHRFVWKVPRYFPYPVTVSFGQPLPATAKPFEIRQAVQDLNAEAWQHRRKLLWPLHRAFVHRAQHHPRRFFMADARTPHLNFGTALSKTVFLARRLHEPWRDQKMVGILLPPSVGGALVNYAALLNGKVPVNLNYTANDEVLASCARQCDLKTVITSKAFLEKVKIKVPGTVIYLEDLTANPRLGEKLVALLFSRSLGPKLLERTLAGKVASLDDLATIIFSSGSTGEPKGVMLSHWNVRSNIEQMGQTFAFSPKDRILGILPFFHSFGYTGTLMAPAVTGFSVVYHPTPLDARAIGELVRNYRCTFLLATPTFLQLYLRLCPPEDFGSLQFVVTGAEKLPDRLAQAFEDQFGIRPLEGYGATECAPAVAVNTHDFRAAGFRQVGAKRGKIGHPLPGITVRIVDPDTRATLPVGQPGMLLVRGPNVMQGYLDQPAKTAAVLQDGWYTTGDIATIDEDGFLQITDRLSRFSKIGGEMVPHIKVEEKLHELAAVNEQVFVVTGVPDEKKGERLVVVHTLSEDKLAPVIEKLAASDLPNLWKPKADQFLHVGALPYLGTGKLDLRCVRELALGATGEAQSGGGRERA
jgi:acyl-[acyl-carrier-protein]-phospholipid O-acyltransferase/long-chain-fatty-acid--[acyl-carrier-protein] ligase